MTKLTISIHAYGEIFKALEREGRSINDGKPLTLEKGDALVPPMDLRLVGMRQNVLMAASNIHKQSVGDFDAESFIKFCDKLFDWSLNGKKE